jgi:hypothetical protein
MAKFMTEPGREKEAPGQAPTAGAQQRAQRDATDAARRAPKEEPTKQPVTKESKNAAQVPKDLTAAAKDKTERQEAGEVPDDKPVEAAEEAEKGAGYLPDEKVAQMKSGELGRHYKNLKKENIGLKAALTKAREAQANDPERTKATAQAAELQAKLDAAQAELRYTNFEASDEFKNTYWQPYEKAYNEGRDLTTELLVKEKKNDLDEVVRAGRVGTFEDFDAIVNEPNTAKAAQIAHDLFGEVQAAEVMRARRDVRKLSAATEEARAKFKKEGGEIFKKQQQERQEQQQRAHKTYQTAVKEGVEKHKQWFGEVEGDDAANAALAKGMLWADTAFTGVLKQADGSERRLNPEELAQVHAAIRNKAGAFDKLAYQMKQRDDKIKELEAKLKEFEESEPREGEGARRGNGDGAGVQTQRGRTSDSRNIEERMSRFVT